MDNVVQSLVGKELIDISGILSEYGEPAYRARQLYQGLYRERAADLSRITTLPLGVRSRLAGQYCTGLPSVQEGIRSPDGTVRYLLTLCDGKVIESVFLPEVRRDTLCISTQAGSRRPPARSTFSPAGRSTRRAWYGSRDWWLSVLT